jgi:nucleotide-binding universal stress UspA family protein
MIGVSDTQPTNDKYPAAGPCVLGPVGDGTVRRRAASLAHALATSRNLDLLVSSELSSTNAELLPESHRESHCSSTTGIETGETLDPVVSRHNPSALVVKRNTGGRLFGGLFSDRAERLSTTTDVLTVDGRGDTDRIASVLVPIAGGDHSQLAVETGLAVARANDAAVDLFHVIEDDSEAARDRGQTLLDSVMAAISDAEADRVDTWLYEAPDAPEAITEQSRYYDLTVMGAPTDGPLERFVFGSTSKQVQREADSPVIVAHAKNVE